VFVNTEGCKTLPNTHFLPHTVLLSCHASRSPNYPNKATDEVTTATIHRVCEWCVLLDDAVNLAKIISMVDERNNSTEHSLNGTDGKTKVLGEEPVLVTPATEIPTGTALDMNPGVRGEMPATVRGEMPATNQPSHGHEWCNIR
jgi:hypothetical protein